MRATALPVSFLALIVACAPAAVEGSAARRSLLARLPGDLQMVRVYRQGLADTVAFLATRPDLFPADKVDQPRLLTREQRETAWGAWRRFLDYILALEEIRAAHAGFWRLAGTDSSRSFLIAEAAYLAELRHALEFIERVERDPGFHKLFNEPVPELGLPARGYARLKNRALGESAARNFAALRAVEKLFPDRGDEELGRLADADAWKIWARGLGQGERMAARNQLRAMKDLGLSAWFPVQSGMAEVMGDTKVWRWKKSLVSPRQIRDLQPRLEPGDILLERREWYLSNVGLPGWWPHAALYVGTPAERRGYFADEPTRSWVREQGEPSGELERLLETRRPAALRASLEAEEGHPRRILEAISEGVVFTSLEHSAACDSLAVLRPRFSRQQKAAAIYQAMLYAGRPYDFDFDFRTDSALVCTELVCKAYEPGRGAGALDLPVAEVLGRPTIPANLFVQKFDDDFGTPAQQMDLVVFLDGDERGKRAVERDVAEFRRSWRRPKWHLIRAGLLGAD